MAGAGFVALIVGIALFVMSGGGDPDENARVAVDRLKLAKRSETGVKPVDMSQYERALQFAVKPATISEIEETGGNFLVSARRVFCKFCKKPMRDGTKVCPFCGETQPEPEKVAVDTDGDGLPDDWEAKYGLNVAQNDAETAEANMATAQDVPELPEAIPPADMIGGPMDDFEQSSFL